MTFMLTYNHVASLSVRRGADLYPGVNSLVHGGAGKVSKAGIERMTQDLEKQ